MIRRLRLAALAVLASCAGSTALPPLAPAAVVVAPSVTACGRLRALADADDDARLAYVRYCVVPYLPPPAPVPYMGKRGAQLPRIG